MSTPPTGSTVDAYGRTAPPLDAEALGAAQAVLDDLNAASARVKTLDMSNSAHHRFVLDRLGGEDFLERYFPSAHTLIKTARAAHDASGGPEGQTLLEMDDPATDQWHPLVEISYLGLEPDGVRVIAQGLVTLPSMAASITSNLLLLDRVSGAVLASVTVPTQFNLGTQVSDLTGLLPADTPPTDVVAVLTAQYLAAGATVATQVSASALLDEFQINLVQPMSEDPDNEQMATPIQSITVTNPNHNSHTERDYIKVGLNRTPDQIADCDYYYQYGNDGSKPIVGLQVSGSAALIGGYTVAASPNFSGSCVLIRRSGTGDGATLAFPSDQIPQACTGAGSAVNWNIGPDWLQGAPWDQGDVVDLDFTLNFAVQPGGTATLRVTSVPQGVGTPPNNIATVAPIKFVWGCVAAGTLVRMADGDLRPIETLKAGERVADGQGASLRIAEVWRGHEAAPLYRLATPSGADVRVTAGHPVPTADGVKAACDLAAGMMVTTRTGQEALSVIERVSHDGAVINLDLLPDGADTLAEIADDVVTAFEAGGIVIGDNRMQGVLVQQALAAPGPDPFETLGPQWRLDIINSQRLQAGLPLIERLSA